MGWRWLLCATAAAVRQPCPLNATQTCECPEGVVDILLDCVNMPTWDEGFCRLSGSAEACPLTCGCAPATDHFVGEGADAHGCVSSAGYSWCEPSRACVRAWETPCGDVEARPPNHVPGDGDEDAHGCHEDAGYSWCETSRSCVDAPCVAPKPAPPPKSSAWRPFSTSSRISLRFWGAVAAGFCGVLACCCGVLVYRRPRPRPRLKFVEELGEDVALTPWRGDTDDDDAEWNDHWRGVLERAEHEASGRAEQELPDTPDRHDIDAEIELAEIDVV